MMYAAVVRSVRVKRFRTYADGKFSEDFHISIAEGKYCDMQLMALHVVTPQRLQKTVLMALRVVTCVKSKWVRLRLQVQSVCSSGRQFSPRGVTRGFNIELSGNQYFRCYLLILLLRTCNKINCFVPSTSPSGCQAQGVRMIIK